MFILRLPEVFDINLLNFKCTAKLKIKLVYIFGQSVYF